jgi:hypothetical protein
MYSVVAMVLIFAFDWILGSSRSGTDRYDEIEELLHEPSSSNKSWGPN